MYKSFGKRTFDIILSVTGLIILSPFFVLITIVLWFFNSKKVLFKQLRPGLNENIFMIYKFSTMNENADANGNLLPDSQRTTRIGNFLRKTSLDELPQLWNVLNGDMSIVGPRPLLVEYLSRYSVQQKKRHSVKPGITGLAQVKGRNALLWEKKFEYDVYYADNLSLSLDLEILGITLKQLFSRVNVADVERNIPDKFLG